MTIPMSRFDADTAVDDTLQFQKTARTRRSFRGFLGTSVPGHIIQEVLKDAQCAPSNCNTQPWDVHIVRGQKLKELSQILYAKNTAGEFTPDFSFDMNAFYGIYGDRKNAQGKAYYEAMNVMREDKEGRRRAAALNLSFFNASRRFFCSCRYLATVCEPLATLVCTGKPSYCHSLPVG